MGSLETLSRFESLETVFSLSCMVLVIEGESGDHNGAVMTVTDMVGHGREGYTVCAYKRLAS